MIILKIWYHLIAITQRLFYKMIYGDKLSIGRATTWRRGFSLMLDRNAKVEIGQNCFFNNDCSIASNKWITIGGGTIFGENVKIYDHNHRFNRPIPIKEQGFSNGEIHIGKHCWIGSNVVILKGTDIGDNCVIGAGCVISGEIPKNSLVTAGRDIEMQHLRMIE